MRILKYLTRWVLFLAGIFTMGLGIALVVKCGLGTSPISSVAYVLTNLSPLSFGQWTFLFCVVFFLLQLLLLGKKMPRLQYLQLLICPLLGLSVDVGMGIFADFHPSDYLVQLPFLLVGCLVLAGGTFLQVRARVVLNPGEGIVKALAERLGWDFGKTKVGFDISQVAIALILSLTAFHSLKGLREGTLVSALAVGLIIRGLGRGEKKLREWVGV